MSTCSPSYEQDEGILTCEEGHGASQEVQGSLTAGEGEVASQQVLHAWLAFVSMMKAGSITTTDLRD
jgi:hypothetical protein